MHKVILIMLLAVVSNSAMAEWVQVSHTAKSSDYANPATISKVGNIATMWYLTDYAEPMNFGDGSFRSMNMRHEYDCREKQWRRVAITFFSKNMGKGKTIRTFSETESWKGITLDSIQGSAFTLACK